MSKVLNVLVSVVIIGAFALLGFTAYYHSSGSNTEYSHPEAPILEVPIVDETGTLTPEEIKSISRAANNIADRDTGEIAVYVTSRIPDGLSIEEASNRVARDWEFGDSKRNDGVLLFVAIDDREFRWEVARGADDRFTDAYSKRTLNRMTEYFKEGDYGEGIRVGISDARTFLNGGEESKELAEDLSLYENLDESSSNHLSKVAITFFILTPVLILFILFFTGNVEFYVPSYGSSGSGGSRSGGSRGTRSGGGGGFGGGGSSGRW